MNALQATAVQLPGWVSYIQALGPTTVAIIAATIAASITWFVQTKQIEVARGVKEIARAQYETASTKLRLDLFDKIFNAYSELIEVLNETFNYSGDYRYEEINELHTKFDKACLTIEFLFNKELYIYLTTDARSIRNGYIDAVENAQNAVNTEDEEPCDRTRRLLVHEFLEADAKVHRMAREYLMIVKEKSLTELSDQS